MALGITSVILDIVQNNFVGSHVIVLDGSSTRTHYFTLQHSFATSSTTTQRIIYNFVLNTSYNVLYKKRVQVDEPFKTII